MTNARLLVTVCPRWHPDQLQADTLVSSGPGMCRARLVCSGPRVCMILGSSVGPRSCWVAAGPIYSSHQSPISSLQQTPLHRSGATRTHRRSSGRVGWDPTSSERSPYSHQKCCESRRRAARGDIIISYKFSCRRVFFNFLLSRLVGLSIHNNFSTSAATCALGERGVNRNRVTG